jgi:hypothetical protein
MPRAHPLTPAERSLRARIAAHTRWSREDPVAGTEAARAASPASDAFWEHAVDPAGELDELERQRRARSAKAAHFTRLAFRSARARRRGGGGDRAA